MSELITKQQAIDAIGEIHPLDYNAQAIKARIERLPSAEITLKQVKAYCEPRCLTVVTSELVQHWKNILSEEPLTDIEQRIFLAAMRKEEEVCRKVDKEIDGDINLTHVCKEIERKVKGALWS